MLFSLYYGYCTRRPDRRKLGVGGGERCAVYFPVSTFFVSFSYKMLRIAVKCDYTPPVPPNSPHCHPSCFALFYFFFFCTYFRLDRQMREMREEMSALSRQEDEHKKRKTDAVSSCRLAFHFLLKCDYACCKLLVAVARNRWIRKVRAEIILNACFSVNKKEKLGTSLKCDKHITSLYNIIGIFRKTAGENTENNQLGNVVMKK